MERLARAYEAEPGRRDDLVQEIHLALWRSFRGFDGRCSLRTWIYRVAHNTATSYVIRQKRINGPLASIGKSMACQTAGRAKRRRDGNTTWRGCWNWCNG